jgi:hypothetical protein
MAKYETTKTLKKAQPTVRTADNVVKQWEIEVIYSHTNADGKTWTRAYPHTEDVEYLNKTTSDFTKAELIGFMPSNMDTIFDAHYDAHNTPPTEERVSNFSINDLQ